MKFLNLRPQLIVSTVNHKPWQTLVVRQAGRAWTLPAQESWNSPMTQAEPAWRYNPAHSPDQYMHGPARMQHVGHGARLVDAQAGDVQGPLPAALARPEVPTVRFNRHAQA